MVIDNKKRSINIKRIFYLGSLLVIAAAIFAFFELYGAALISGGIFAVWILFFQFADYQFVEFSNENGQIVIRYYPIAKFGKKKYNTIEFSQQVLHEAKFENGVFGLFADLNLAIKTKRGIAEYPPVSLTAISKYNIDKMEDAFQKLLDK